MNHWIVRLVALGVPVFLLLAGCQSESQTAIPITGIEVVIPAQIEQARVNVLEYVISSPDLANIPPNKDWQFDNSKQWEDEYHFFSGDWLMIIWAAVNHENQRVVISNRAEEVFWCGYVTSDGRVMDTAYIR